MKGTLYGVGVGPGDPELLTVKAVRTIECCPVIAAPDTGGGESLALRIAGQYLTGKEIVLCSMPMTRDALLLESCHSAAAAQLCAYLERGEDVAFLTLGDPSVYATYSYLHRLVAAQGYRAVMIPGVPSFCAAAAALGEPLCEGDEPLHILPASCRELPGLLEARGGKVIMKMGKQRGETLKLLEKKGMLERAALVERCTMPEETVFRDLSSLPGDSGYFAVVIVKEDG